MGDGKKSKLGKLTQTFILWSLGLTLALSGIAMVGYTVIFEFSKKKKLGIK